MKELINTETHKQNNYRRNNENLVSCNDSQLPELLTLVFIKNGKTMDDSYIQLGNSQPAKHAKLTYPGQERNKPLDNLYQKWK